MWRASYRDYGSSRSNICNAEPRWLEEELLSVNGVLAHFLEHTDHGRDAQWSSNDLDLLEEGQKSLPPVMEIHHRNLEAMSHCGFAKDRGFPTLLSRGREYLDQAEARLEGAQALLDYIAAKRALALWRQEQPNRQFSAKQTCPERSRKKPANLYYAYEAESGQVRWLFCDGSRVTTASSGSLEFQPPADANRRELRRIKARDYLKAAQNYPKVSVDRPPSLPNADVADAGKDER